jgi:NAD(P)-dependent dehydrogenase (short-subunit alcohol dehydrogenase family)
MPLVTVFGGTGFLGRRIVERLTAEGATVQVAVRHPEPVDAGSALAGCGRIVPISVDVRDEETVLSGIAGVESVVNTVSTYVEKGGATYTAVHVHGASNVAKACARHGVSRLLHISGIRRRSRIAVRLHPRARSRGTRGAEGVSRRDAASSMHHVRHRRCFPSRVGSGRPINAYCSADRERTHKDATYPCERCRRSSVLVSSQSGSCRKNLRAWRSGQLYHLGYHQYDFGPYGA